MNLDMGIGTEVEVIRTNRRKTASVKIVDGLVQVIVPKRLSKQRIEDLINKRRAWIMDKLRIHANRPPVTPKEYVNGECFPYLGKNYKLKLVMADFIGAKLKDGYLTVGMNSTVPASKTKQHVKDLITAWYIERAKERLEEKTNRYAKVLGLEPNSINVKEYKSRWGSCSTKGDISYNWKIILAPHNIADYVVVHELCHMLEHNHSPKFWKHVERTVADYKERKLWLRQNGEQLMV